MVLLSICILWLAFFLASRLYTRSLISKNRHHRSALLSALNISQSKRLVGFFHPYCNAGGGGERVLWTAIAALQHNEHDVVSVVYTGDVGVSKTDILAKVKARFDITLDPSTLHFVFLQSRWLVEDTTWPHFTLLGQSFGSMYLAWEAMSRLIPDLYIDTMGYAFTFHVVSWLSNIPTGAYVHYPTISTDMVARVRSRRRGHTNTGTISSSVLLSWAKLLYYRIFMYYYSRSLANTRFLMVNSSWTKNHIDSLLQYKDTLVHTLQFLPPFIFFYLMTNLPPDRADEAQIVYPPCDTREMAKFALQSRERVILSVAQFRPEKDHAAQLLAFDKLLRSHPEYAGASDTGVKLVLLGGCRNPGDAARVESLRRLSQELGIQDHVQFIVNAPYPDVLMWLSRASIGLSTMVDEHFGINIVEMMAAGVIPVTHASGGPLRDIVVPLEGEPTGYHAKTPDEFAEVLHTVLTLSTEQELAMRGRARMWAVQRFSEEEFEKAWNKSGWRGLLSP